MVKFFEYFFRTDYGKSIEKRASTCPISKIFFFKTLYKDHSVDFFTKNFKMPKDAKVKTSQCNVFDFTLSEEYGGSPAAVIEALRPFCKKYAFQLEQGSTTGFRHFQGRVSLISKKRQGELRKFMAGIDILKHARWSVTSTNAKGDEFYVLKAETRIDGPWTDRNERYIPLQYRVTLRPWQNTILERRLIFDSRHINVIVDSKGGIGKSTLAGVGLCKYDAIWLSCMSDSERLTASVCDILSTRNERHPKLMFLDLPRSLNAKKLPSLFAAIEMIKNGVVCDTRYHYRQWVFDSPHIWVFCNMSIPVELLSRDRWLFWRINQNMDLEPIDPNT